MNKIEARSLASLGSHRYQTLNGGRRMLGILSSLAVSVILLSMLTTVVYGAPPASQPRSTDAFSGVFASQHVDAPKFFHWMSSRSLRLDSSKYPHIAYGGDHLYYASYDGSSWKVTTVDNNYNVGMYASLALDSNGNPHISYYDARRGSLKYAYFNGSTWQIQVVDSDPRGPGLGAGQGLDGNWLSDQREWRLDNSQPDPITDTTPSEITPTEVIPSESFPPEAAPASLDDTGIGLYSAIAVDAFNHPSISYYDSFNKDLKYAHWNGFNWEIEVVDSDYDVGMYTSLAVDSLSNPHISYYDSTNGDLRYAHWNGSKWDYKLVDSGGTVKDDVGRYTSIVLGKHKEPYISYYNSTQGDLKLANREPNSSTWIVKTVDSAGNVGLYTSIALNNSPEQKPFITYYADSPNNDLKYAQWDGSAWSIYTVPLTGDVGRYTSLVWVSNNNLQVSFYDSTNGLLKYAKGSGASWTIQTVDSGADVGLYTSLKFDTNNHPHISYFDDTLNDLKYAYYNGANWVIQKVDTTGKVGLYTSLALDASNNPHIGYYDATKEAVKYASWTGSAWEIKTVDKNIASSAYIADGMGISLVLDSGGNPRIAYFEGLNKDLKVALWSGVAWVIKTVDGGGGDDMGRYPSMAIDSANHLHLSYYNASNKVLRYAKGSPDGSSWDKAAADQTAEVGKFTSLALDTSGNPSIAYFDDNGDIIKYAWYNGIWQNERVKITVGGDDVFVEGIFPSLALDGTGDPYISFYDPKSRTLRLAVKHLVGFENKWEIFVVDNEGEVGRYSSVALDATGTVGISYYDDSNGDLKYARSLPPDTNPYKIYLPFIILNSTGQ